MLTVTKARGAIEHKLSPLEHHQWIKVDGNGESQSTRNVNETWQMMQHHQLSYPPPTHLINTPTMEPELININKSLSNHHPTSFLIAPPPPPPLPYSSRTHEEIFINSHFLNVSDEDEEEGDDSYEKSQTLQLFPPWSGDSYANEKEMVTSLSEINSSAAHPHQFFEFLPLKN